MDLEAIRVENATIIYCFPYDQNVVVKFDENLITPGKILSSVGPSGLILNGLKLESAGKDIKTAKLGFPDFLKIEGEGIPYDRDTSW